MKTWKAVVPALLGLALAGCRTDPEIAYLQRDNRTKEQEIYRLRNRIEDLQDALNGGTPAQPITLRGVPAGEMPPEPGAIERPRSRSGNARPAPSLAPPGQSNPNTGIPAPGSLEVSPGTEVPAGEIPERMKAPGSNTPPSGTPSGGTSSRASSQWTPAGSATPVSGVAPTDNSPVAQITLHPALTGGIGTGARASDDGLLVVVEPRDFGGNILNAPGDISVALLDPALTGEQARLARWDFPTAETQRLTRAGSQPGIHLRLPWVTSPAHDRLKVFVRYTTRDGRKLQAERLISVALNGPQPVRQDVLPETSPVQTASRPQRPQWSPVR
jgi:hypothetical protein